MKSEWKECTLDYGVKFKNGKKRPSVTGKYPVYGGNGILDYATEFNDENVVIIGRVGAFCGSVYYEQNKCWISDNAISAQNTNNTTIEYVYYLLSSLNLNKRHIGTSQPLLTQEILSKIEVILPSLSEQKAIASILSSLDDKIELNNRINANLEAQAQAIFKSWFVDFEPFGGTMPDDWITGKAEDFFDISIGKTPPRKEPQWFTTNPQDVIWASISDMGSCGAFISDSSEYLTPESITRFNVKIIPDHTVILSFKLTVGRVAITDGEMSTNEAIAHFKQSDDIVVEYLYCYLKAFDYHSLGSTSSIATAVNSKTVKAMTFIMPAEKVLQDFHQVVSAFFELIKINLKENKSLITLRNTLLPKLMSGEIEVPAAEEIIKKGVL